MSITDTQNPLSRIPIEELFSSKGRIKILKELATSNELNISELCRRVSLNHSSTKSHLEVLIDSGLVEEKIFGRIKIYRYRIEDLRARSFRNLFDLWDS
ncbi:MAG: ArsR family transcriptional regulator [Candidatus Thorarchaeota archaeon]|nr:ArsR family transcriptional regulator [Candidatus Thorarchaeota archaeon]